MPIDVPPVRFVTAILEKLERFAAHFGTESI